MNRSLYFFILCALFWSCNGQTPKKKGTEKTEVSEIVELISVVESESREVDSTKSENKIPNRPKLKTKKADTKENGNSEKKLVQVDTVSIWDADQLAYLKLVDTIQLFHVRTTDIGSRKLEFDSEFTTAERDSFIKLLLDAKNFVETDSSEFAAPEGKFEPIYQLLLVGKGERLTLMLNTEGNKLLVANLFQRHRHEIKGTIMTFIENLKKK